MKGYQPTISQILTIRQIRRAPLGAIIFFVNFPKVFDSIRRFMVRSPTADTDFFHTLIGVLQGDTLISFLLIIYLDYVLRTSIYIMKENGFTFKKKASSHLAFSLRVFLASIWYIHTVVWLQ